MKKIVIINRNVIAANKKHGKNDPPISVREGRNGKPDYHLEFEFKGKCKLVYNPNKPLKCGATVWLEVDEE